MSSKGWVIYRVMSFDEDCGTPTHYFTPIVWQNFCDDFWCSVWNFVYIRYIFFRGEPLLEGIARNIGWIEVKRLYIFITYWFQSTIKTVNCLKSVMKVNVVTTLTACLYSYKLLGEALLPDTWTSMFLRSSVLIYPVHLARAILFILHTQDGTSII